LQPVCIAPVCGESSLLRCLVERQNENASQVAWPALSSSAAAFSRSRRLPCYRYLFLCCGIQPIPQIEKPKFLLIEFFIA
jgi:hypothetical protein